jgi:hypothetical protein
MHRQLLGTAVHAPHDAPRRTLAERNSVLLSGTPRTEARPHGQGSAGLLAWGLRRSLAGRFAGGCRAARAARADIAVPKPHSVLAGPLRDSKIGVPADAAPGTIVSSNPDIPAGEGRWVT